MFYGGILLLLTTGFAYAVVDYTGYVVISALAKTQEELDFLLKLDYVMDDELDFLMPPALGRNTDFMVRPDSVVKAKRVLRKFGIEYHVSDLDMKRHVDIQKRSIGNEQTRNITNSYLRYDEIMAFVYGMETDYPDRVRVRVFGKSYEGRDLLEVRISSDLNSIKPAIWLEFLAHAREWISQSTGLNVIHQLASGTPDGESMLVNYDWYIVPVLNPDGYEYTHTDDRMWRKNRQKMGRCCVGVDLNRNWNISFEGTVPLDNCMSSTFPGEEAFSAPETAALKMAIEQTQNVTAFFSIHSYRQWILLPYGYTEEMVAVAESIENALETIRGTDYTVETEYDASGYPSGIAFHYWYDKGIKYSYVLELPPRTFSQGHFMLPTSEIYPVAMEVIAGLKAFSELELDI